MDTGSSPHQLPKHVQFLISELQLKRLTHILDVGANPINEAPYSELLRGGGCRVIGFEPQTEAFEALQVSKGPNEVYYPHAVGDGNVHKLHIYRSGGYTSFFRPHPPSVKVYGSRWTRIMSSVDLPTVALDDLSDLEAIDMLKIDIQGGEKLVIENARKVLSNSVAIIIELRYLQLYENEPMVGGIDELLRGQGFMLHKFLFNTRRAIQNSQSNRLRARQVSDQLIDGDAVYLRHLGRIENFTDEQIGHLAVLSSSVFSSHSAALYALDELVRRRAISDSVPGRYVDCLPDNYRV